MEDKLLFGEGEIGGSSGKDTWPDSRGNLTEHLKNLPSAFAQCPGDRRQGRWGWGTPLKKHSVTRTLNLTPTGALLSSLAVCQSAHWIWSGPCPRLARFQSAAAPQDNIFRVTRYLSNPLLDDSPHEDQKAYAGGKERSRGSGMFTVMRIKGYFPWFKDEGEVVAGFGEARLIKYLDGKLELKGGSEGDRIEAREWISLFWHEAVVREV